MNSVLVNREKVDGIWPSRMDGYILFACLPSMHLRAVWAGLGWFVSSIFSFTQGGSYFGFGRVLIYIANTCMGFDRTGIQRFFLIIAHSVCWSIHDGLESE
jgi:hypothetical protein